MTSVNPSSAVVNSSSVPVPLSASRGQLSFAPRPSNTGAQMAFDGFRGSRLDWLDFTVKGFSWEEVARQFLRFHPSSLIEMEGGARGHSHGLQFSDCTLLHSPGHPERGVKVVLSASALAGLPVDHLELLRQILNVGGSIARIDLAFDDCSGAVSPGLIAEMEDQGKVVSHFSRSRRIVEKCRKTGGLTGDSLVFGSRCSERYVRIYDKRLEQMFAKGVLAEDLPASWCRIELEAKKRAALVVAGALVAGGLESIPSILRGVFDVRELNQVHSSRRVPCDWWLALFAGAAIIKTGVQKLKTTIEQKLVWLSRTAKKALGQVVSVYGAPVVQFLVTAGIDATTPREWAQLVPAGVSLNLGVELRDVGAITPF